MTSIKLSSNDIGYESAIALAQTLENNTVLTLVDLSKNEWRRWCYSYSQYSRKEQYSSLDGFFQESDRSSGAKAIAETLEKNTTLTSINLSLNSIGYQGVMALAQALRKQ